MRCGLPREKRSVRGEPAVKSRTRLVLRVSPCLVGTGWSRMVSSEIRKQLDTVVSPKSRLTKPVRKPKATWVEPSFVADVEFRDITSEGLLRQSSFKGLSKKEH